MAELKKKPFFGEKPRHLWGTLGGDAKRQAVFLQCGRGSIHESWLSNTGRSWDLIVNYYDESFDGLGIGDVAFYQRGTKFSGIYNVVQHHPGILDYSHILLLDDDLLLGVEALNRLFAIAARENLQLFQPSLTARSPCAWPALKHQANSDNTRAVSAVEIMMPGFSGKALAHCLSDFPRSLSGWGLDLLFSLRVGERFGATPLVVDAVQATHTKEINTADGSYYRFLQSLDIDPQKELHAICEEFGLTVDITTL